jgi:signal transduction histidine kinase
VWNVSFFKNRFFRVVATAALTVLLLSTLTNFALSLNANFKQTSSSLHVTASNAAARLEDGLFAVAHAAIDTVRTTPFEGGIRAGHLARVREFLRQQPLVTGVWLVNAEQSETWSVNRDTLLEKRERKDPISFSDWVDARSSGTLPIQVRVASFGQSSDGNALPILCVREVGGRRVELQLVLSEDQLRKTLTNIAPSESSVVRLIDGHANVFSVSPMTSRQRESVTASAFTSWMSKLVKHFDLNLGDSATGRRVYVDQRLSRLPWYVQVSSPASVLTERLLAEMLANTIVLLLAFVVAILLSARMARSIQAPVNKLYNLLSGLPTAESFGVAKSTEVIDELDALLTSAPTIREQLANGIEQLEARVLERTRELASLNERLESASREKTRFLTHMSHELRTPLNAVIGFSDLLTAQYFGPLNAKQSEYVRDINASGQHLLSLINDILDLAKVESGRMELMLGDSQIVALVESCRALVSERINRAQQVLGVHVSNDVSNWWIDERKVKQCLLNLLTNASKFTPSGGTITLHVEQKENALTFTVTDTGVGISTEDQAQLFSEFFQARSRDVPRGATSEIAPTSAPVPSREGTGLGLALTRRFVELHGGTISVSSIVGQGTIFTMQLPWREGV